MHVRSTHKWISKLDIYSKSTNSQYPMITFRLNVHKKTFYLSLPTNNVINRLLLWFQISFTALIKKTNNTSVLCKKSPPKKLLPIQQLTQEIGCQTADKVNANCSLIAKWDVKEVKDVASGPNIHHIISLNQKLLRLHKSWWEGPRSVNELESPGWFTHLRPPLMPSDANVTESQEKGEVLQLCRVWLLDDL